MVSVPLVSKKRRRALAVQKFQHLVPAVPLLAAGLSALQHGAHGAELALAIFEIATSALLFGTVARELRGLTRRHPHVHSPHSVDWFHVFAAGVLLAEALERWHLTHHWARPTLLLSAVTLALGLFHGRIEAGAQRRRALRLDAGGIYVGGKPFRPFRATWDDVASIEIGPRYATIRTRTGRERRLDLGDLEDAAAVRAALTDARSRLS